LKGFRDEVMMHVEAHVAGWLRARGWSQEDEVLKKFIRAGVEMMLVGLAGEKGNADWGLRGRCLRISPAPPRPMVSSCMRLISTTAGTVPTYLRNNQNPMPIAIAERQVYTCPFSRPLILATAATIIPTVMEGHTISRFRISVLSILCGGHPLSSRSTLRQRKIIDGQHYVNCHLEV
jgi:hypothetical protein